MSDYKVGYGKPPKGSQFKQGVSGNPNGRPKRKSPDSADTILDVLNTPTEYREGGRVKQVTRQELGIKLLIQRAMTDVGAAATLLKARIKADRAGSDAHSVVVEVMGWWHEHNGRSDGAPNAKALDEPTLIAAVQLSRYARPGLRSMSDFGHSRPG